MSQPTAAKTVARLLESEAPETTTFRDVFYNDVSDVPEEWVQDLVGHAYLDLPVPVREVDPAKLITASRKPLRACTNRAKKKAHVKHVEFYRQNPGPPIVLAGNRILDGHHRALAAYLDRRHVQAVDITDLAEEVQQ